MTLTAELAAFVDDVTDGGLPPDVADATKRRLLDAVGVAAAASGADVAPLRGVRATVDVEGGDACRRWAADGARAGPAGAAMDGTALVRALDYADAFLAPDGPSYPSDVVAACVAAAEYAEADGRTLLAALACAYEVHGELAWHAPVREHGRHPAVHTLVSATCGAAVALGLDVAEASEALRLAVDGAGPSAVDEGECWPPLASANAARNAVYAALLAANGLVGPPDALEDHPVLRQVDVDATGDVDDPGHIYADPQPGFGLDADCGRLRDVTSRPYAAPFAAQSAIDVVVDLATRVDLDADDVEALTLRTFDPRSLDVPAIDTPSIDADDVETPAEAARSLPYALAAALCDRAFGPPQLVPERIDAPDVRRLLARVTVEVSDPLTVQSDAGLMPAAVDLELADGTVHHAETGAFPGHPTQPMDWEALEAKTRPLLTAAADPDRADAVVHACRHVDEGSVADLLDAVA